MKAVWIADPQNAFIKAQLLDNGKVQHPDGTLLDLPLEETFQVNPAQFDKADDIAELTFLNEASVVNNLSTRYQADKIYTYSGLFLVAVNPYKQLDIYSQKSIKEFAARSREECGPHIYAVAEAAFRQMLDTRENQSILITGESGAGKTENTKRTIQYLSAITSKQPLLEQKILQTNPVLEAFGNAQTVRNNNSSRFGKFIRIEFAKTSAISGASIDWYLLEKSRVITQSPQERNYHIFYYLLTGTDEKLRQSLGLPSQDPKHYRYLAAGKTKIEGINDMDEFRTLLAALKTVGFTQSEIDTLLQVVAAVLLLGNIEVTALTTDQGRIPNMEQVRKVCKLLGVKQEKFAEILLKPKIKAGREVVAKANSADQIRHSINALAMALYERLFGHLVTRLNAMLQPLNGPTTSSFIGVLDIAGFEIFENNSFEQLCINYTNEKLQQFFNHHMFVLEQAEYLKEEIEWEYVDYGSDLQPTIDLIEKQTPMGIFACLDEDCVMPRATDRSFTDKLTSNWTEKSPNFRPSRLNQGFIVSHYAGNVEYSTEGWLEKNKDPLNDQITELLSQGSNQLVTTIFSESPSAQATPRSPRKGIFRTVSQRHKEQLTDLMAQLASTQPHFVRCIVPNQKKTPGKFENKLVLDQLRCNGVLEGIRIARSGFPNRVEFKEFKERYQALLENSRRPPADIKLLCDAILRGLQLNPSNYKIGTSKVFFKNGVLAELEEMREKLIATKTLQVQSIARGYLTRKRVQRQAFRNHAAKTLALTARLYLENRNDGWWKTYQNFRPLLASTESQQNTRKDVRIQRLEQNLEKSRTDYTSLESKHKNLTHTVHSLEQTQRDLETQLLEKQSLAAKTQAELKEAKAKMEQLTATAAKELEGTKSAHANAIDKLGYELRTHQEQLESAKLRHATLEKEHTGLKSQFSAVRKSHDSLKEAHDQLSAKHLELESTHQRLDQSTKEADKNARASKTQVDNLNAKVEEQSAEIKQLKAGAASTAKEIAAKNDTIAAQKQELDNLRSQVLKIESELVQSRSLVSEHETLKRSIESTKLQFSSRLQEYVTKLEAADQENKRLKARIRDAQVDGSKMNKVAEELDTLTAILSGASVDPKDLASELKNAKGFDKLCHDFSEVRRVIEANGFSVNTLAQDLEGAKRASLRAQRAESTAKSLETNTQKYEEKIKQLVNVEEHLAKSEALNKAQLREITALKAVVEQAKEREAEAASKASNALSEASLSTKAQMEALEGSLSSSNHRNRELESELARFKQKFFEMEQAHGSLADINRKLEKIQQEKADMLAANTKLMFGMEQQRRSSRESSNSPTPESGPVRADSKASAGSRSLESEIKVLQLRLLKSERARKVAISNALGNNGDELLKERDEALRALAHLKRITGQQDGGSNNITPVPVDSNRVIEVPKRRALRTISNHQPGGGGGAGKRTSSHEKNQTIAQLHDTLKEESENLEIYRKRANDYQAKTQQAEVIMLALQQSEKALLAEIEELKAQQASEVGNKDKELGLMNETITRLRGELATLKEDYRQRVVVDSNSTRVEAQKRISELLEALKEVTGERDSLLAAKLKLEKRAHYAWADADPLETRKKELEEELRNTRRDLSSTRHELDEIRAKAELYDTRTKSYEDRLAAQDSKNRELLDEVEELRDQSLQKELTVKRLTREIDALQEKTLRLEKFKTRSEQGDQRVFI